MGLSVTNNHAMKGLAADGAGAIWAFIADATATEDDFASIGGLYLFWAGITIQDAENITASFLQR